MALEIRKKSASTWVHVKDGTEIILSQGHFRISNGKFELTEPSGVDQFSSTGRLTAIADITVYDETDAGTPETFADGVALSDRLKALAYPFFKSASGGSGAVDSVFGRIGDVTAQTGDYTMSQITNAVPAGGATGQVLKKVNATDYNYSWQDEAGGSVDVALEEETLTGTYQIDYDTFDSGYWIMTGNTTFTETNDPASGESFTKYVILKSQTLTEVPTFPTFNIVNGTYDPTVENLLEIKKQTTPSEGTTSSLTIINENSGGGSGISNVVEDTTPQLGGNLDVNGFQITSDSNLEFKVDNNDDGTNQFNFLDGDDNTILALQEGDFANNLTLGGNDVRQGIVNLYGGTTTLGGILNIYQGATQDGTVDSWAIASHNGNLKIYNDVNFASPLLEVDDATLAITVPQTSNADIDALGNKALITKEYFDANSGSGGGDLTAVADVTAMRAYTVAPSNNDLFYLQGHTNFGIGGGLYYWDNTSTATDNNGKVIKATTIATGRFIKITENNTVSIEDFGGLEGNASNTNAIDSTQPFRDAINYLISEGGGTLIIPKRTNRFYITDNEADVVADFSNITITGGGKVYIDSANSNESLITGRGSFITLADGTNNFTIKDIDILVAAGAFTGGFEDGVIYSENGFDNVTIDNVKIHSESEADSAIGVHGINFYRDVTDVADTATASNVTIKNCDIRLYGQSIYGIHTLREITGFRVLNNEITLEAWTDDTQDAYNAIAVYGDTEDFEVDGNRIYGSGHSAIAVSMAKKGFVTNNHVYNVMFNETNIDEAGIEIEYKDSHGDDTLDSHSVVVSGNYIENCKYGIAVFERDDSATTLAPHKLIIQSNIIKGSSHADIMVASRLTSATDYTSFIRNVTIDNNICESSASNAGIRVYDGRDITITNNKLDGQANGIKIGRNSTTYVSGYFDISNNKTKNVTTYGLHVETADDLHLNITENKFYDGTYGVFIAVNINAGGNSQLQMLSNFADGQSTDGFYVKNTGITGAVFMANIAINATAQGFDLSGQDFMYTNNISRNCPTADNYGGTAAISTNNKDL